MAGRRHKLVREFLEFLRYEQVELSYMTPDGCTDLGEECHDELVRRFTTWRKPCWTEAEAEEMAREYCYGTEPAEEDEG